MLCQHSTRSGPERVDDSPLAACPPEPKAKVRAVLAVVGFAYLSAEASAQCLIVDKPEELFARSDGRHAAGAVGPAAICWDSGRAGTSSRWVPRDVSLTPSTFLAS